jgi:cold shock CspA family protein
VTVVRRSGTVTTYDSGRGLGTVTDESGVPFGFHCAEISDGTREIRVGTGVTFQALAKLGRYEAADIRPADDGRA